MIVTGDMTQIDLPHEQKSGLKEALKILSGIEGISVVNLSQKDIVRHKLVTRIVTAYDAYDKKQEQEKTNKVRLRTRPTHESQVPMLDTNIITEN